MFSYLWNRIMPRPNQFPLKIRTQDARTHNISVNYGWTIITLKRHLKEELAKIYCDGEGHDYRTIADERIRLLYKGRILNDSDLVKDRLEPDVVCHLIVSPNEIPSPTIEEGESNLAASPQGGSQSMASSLQSFASLMQNLAREAGGSGTIEIVGGIAYVDSPNSPTLANFSPDVGTVEQTRPISSDSTTEEAQTESPTNAFLPERNVLAAGSQLRDMGLPPFSSVHLHVHVSPHELDRVASRSQR